MTWGLFIFIGLKRLKPALAKPAALKAKPINIHLRVHRAVRSRALLSGKGNTGGGGVWGSSQLPAPPHGAGDKTSGKLISMHPSAPLVIPPEPPAAHGPRLCPAYPQATATAAAGSSGSSAGCEQQDERQMHVYALLGVARHPA